MTHAPRTRSFSRAKKNKNQWKRRDVLFELSAHPLNYLPAGLRLGLLALIQTFRCLQILKSVVAKQPRSSLQLAVRAVHINTNAGIYQPAEDNSAHLEQSSTHPPLRCLHSTKLNQSVASISYPFHHPLRLL